MTRITAVARTLRLVYLFFICGFFMGMVATFALLLYLALGSGGR